MLTWCVIEMFLLWVMFPIVGLAAACNIVGRVFASLRNRDGTPEKRTLFTRFSRVVYALVVVNILGLVLIGDHELTLRRDMLSNVAKQRFEKIRIQFDGNSVELTDAEASQFMALLLGGRDVNAHHSSRVQIRRIEIEGEIDYFYTLAEDDSVPDEFWLMDVTCPGCIGEGRKVRQFVSTELSAFMEAHDPLNVD